MNTSKLKIKNLKRNTVTGAQIVNFQPVNVKEVDCIKQVGPNELAFGGKDHSVYFYNISNIASPVLNFTGTNFIGAAGAQCNDMKMYDSDHLAVASNKNIIDVVKISDGTHTTLQLNPPPGHVLSLECLSMFL